MPRRNKVVQRARPNKPLEVKRLPCKPMGCFQCDHTGIMCRFCGESGEVCDCSTDEYGDHKFKKCEDCEGAGRICVEHDSPIGSPQKDAQCDVIKKRNQSTASSTT